MDNTGDELANNIAKYAQWAIVEIACNSEIRHNHYEDEPNNNMSKMRKTIDECGSIDQAIVELSEKLIENKKFKKQWNLVMKMRKKEIKNDDDEYYDEENKLFILVIEYLGFSKINGFHGDNYTEFSNKFFELIDFCQLNHLL